MLYNRITVTLDALFDGVYLASSIVSYVSDCATLDLQAASICQKSFYSLHELGCAIGEIIFFCLYSLTAQYFKKYPSQQTRLNDFFNFFVITWPYFRDFLSGLKNGRHAIVNFGFLFHTVNPTFIYSITNPIGISVGVLLAINLAWYRKMNTRRRNLIESNMKLLTDIQKENTCQLTNNQQISYHSTTQRYINYLSVTFDGLTDGMYLYGCLFMLIGISTNFLSAGTPFIAAITIISIFSIASLICKVHDEYENQKMLRLSEISCSIKLLENNKDRDESAEKMLEKQKKYQNDLLPINEKDLSIIGKFAFFIGRAILSGAKNASSAINSIKCFFSNAITQLVLKITSIVCATIYAIYLAINTTYDQISNHQKKCQTDIFLNKNNPLRSNAEDGSSLCEQEVAPLNAQH